MKKNDPPRARATLRELRELLAPGRPSAPEPGWVPSRQLAEWLGYSDNWGAIKRVRRLVAAGKMEQRSFRVPGRGETTSYYRFTDPEDQRKLEGYLTRKGS